MHTAKALLTAFSLVLISIPPIQASSSCTPKTYPSCCKSGPCPAACPKPYGDCTIDASSKTFFNVRPLYQSARPELVAGFRSERTQAREGGKGGALDFVLFGGNSTKDRRLASYFMPYGKTTLTVSGKDPAPNVTPDLFAPHFNLHTEVGSEHYEGTICFAMSQASFGLGMQYKQRFCWNDEQGRGWWLSLSTPITHVRNKITMYENSNSAELTVNPDAPGAVTSMCAAFNQPTWCYGKIAANTAMKKTGLADIETKLGYQWDIDDQNYVAGYIGMLIPTGNKPKAHYLFEPIVGHGKHVGIMSGGDGNYQLWQHAEKNRSITLKWAAHCQYLFRNTQRRSFDLINKPWSRYLEVYANKEQAQKAEDNGDMYLATPGINLFTRDMKVTPGFNGNVMAAYTLACGGFRGEIGYNLYARQSECVKLACPWPTGDNAPALKDKIGTGFLNPFRLIDGNHYIENLPGGVSPNPFTVAHYQNHVVLPENLDLHSAAHPSILTHMIHTTLGYDWNNITYPTHLHAGASYEFALEKNTTLNRWMVWLKGGISF